MICIILPDDKRLLLIPTEKDIRRENDLFLIKKDIAITQAVWTNSAMLKIQLCKVITGKSLSLSGSYQLAQDEDMKKVMFLDNPVFYHIIPVPVRSNL